MSPIAISVRFMVLLWLTISTALSTGPAVFSMAWAGLMNAPLFSRKYPSNFFCIQYNLSSGVIGYITSPSGFTMLPSIRLTVPSAYVSSISPLFDMMRLVCSSLNITVPFGRSLMTGSVVSSAVPSGYTVSSGWPYSERSAFFSSWGIPL